MDAVGQQVGERRQFTASVQIVVDVGAAVENGLEPAEAQLVAPAVAALHLSLQKCFYSSKHLPCITAVSTTVLAYSTLQTS